MKRRTERTLLIFLVLVLFLGGCGSVPRTKTILLPEEEAKEEDTAGTAGQSYTVRKIYSREIGDGLLWAPEIYLEGDHSFRYWSEKPAESFSDAGETPEISEEENSDFEKGETVLVETAVDYRYGFHEDRILPLETGATGSGALLRDTAQSRQDIGETGCDPVSPDGKYAVYVDNVHTHIGSRLYLVDLETGEKTLLLDGDAQNCSGEDFRILAAWSPDSEVLCYGFCMRELTEEDLRYNAAKSVLHFRQLSSGEHTSMGAFTWNERMKTGEIARIQLYADWKGDRLRAALVYQFTSEQQSTPEEVFHVQFVFADGIGGKSGADYFGWPPAAELLTDTVYGELPVYLDAALDRVYIARENDQNSIISVSDGTGDRVETIECGEDTQILDFLVLDGGDTVITAEKDADAPWADICLYLRSGDTFLRHTLYVGCGYVYGMAYDAAGHRLLIDASNGIDRQDLSFYTWQGIVLEFE